MVNDFEEGIFVRYPAIGEIKKALYDMGAIYASMSGSGSSVFGIFEKPQESLTDSVSVVHDFWCFRFFSGEFAMLEKMY